MFQAEDGIRDLVRSRGLGDVYKRHFKWRFNLQALYRHYDNINIPLSSDHPFSKPALFIKGENSNYILPDDAVLIKELFTHAEVKQIDGAGHWVHADQPVRLKEMVLEFLDKSN